MNKLHSNLPTSMLLYIGILCCLLTLTGCPDENPLLVNPPPTKDSILVRFINVIPNSTPVSATLDETVLLQNVSEFTSSKAVSSPADSVYFKVEQNGTTVYNSTTRYRFFKNSVQTIYALPRLTTTNSTFDTVLVATTSNFSPPGAFASIRVLYFTDNVQQFALRSGCPNGTILTGAFLNQLPSAYQQVLPGPQTISLTKRLLNGTDSTVGTYTVNFNIQGSYTIVLTDYSNKGIKSFLLNEFDNSENAFSELVPTTTQNVSIRTVNVSTSSVDMYAGYSNQIESDLLPQFSSNYRSIPACLSTEKDSIYTKIGGNVVATSLLQVIPPRRYTIVVTDSKTDVASVAIPVEPIVTDTIPAGTSRIRVVQANPNYGNITISVGARFDTSSASNFTTGEVIARQVSFGGVSSGYFSKAGVLPITVFDNATPVNLLMTSLATIEANQSYLLIFSIDPLSKESKLSLVKETDESMQLQPLDRGSMIQFIHGISGLNSSKLSSSSILIDANFNFTNSIVTCLPLGQNQISFNQNSFNINVESNKELQLFTENDNTVEMSTYDFIPGGRQVGILKRRFINASDIPKITITTSQNLVFDLQGNLENVELEHLPFKSESPVTTTNLNQRLSFFFWDRIVGQTSGKFIKSATNLSLPLGKNYSIILVGNVKNGYEVIITQEF
jgi:hypothetical protein